MATQSPFFGKRDRDTDSLTSRPAPLVGSGTNLSGTPVNPSSLTAQQGGLSAAAAPAAKEGGSKLTVGPNIKLKGVEITDCDTLVVEGRVEATLDSRVLEIAENGVFQGTIAVDQAEIRGRFEGEITVRKQLVIHGTGKVSGKIRYAKIKVEEGAELSGDLAMLDKSATAIAVAPKRAANA